MSAAEALKAARAAGIRLEIDGDDLVLEASAPPPPVVLDLLSLHKVHVIAMLRRQKRVDDFGPVQPLRTTNKAQEVELSEEADTGAQSLVHHRTPVEATCGSWHANAEALRGRIINSLDRLPPPHDHNGHRLIAATQKFLKSPWFSEALKCGWSLEELFGVDGSAPLDNFECWGLIVGIALAPKRGDVIERLDTEHAVIRYHVGAPLREARRIDGRFMPTDSSVVWWECSGLVGDVEWLTPWDL